MENSGKIVTGLVAIALIAGSVIVFGRNSNKSNNTDNTSQTSNTQQTGSDSSQEPVAAKGTITYNGSLFSPSQVTVNSGESIKVLNDSSHDIDFESDPHPTHTDNDELNTGTLAAGQSKTFTVTQKGSWGYHNHLDSSQTGTIVVR